MMNSIISRVSSNIFKRSFSTLSSKFESVLNKTTIVCKVSRPQNPGQTKPFSGPPRNCLGGDSSQKPKK